MARRFLKRASLVLLVLALVGLGVKGVSAIVHHFNVSDTHAVSPRWS